MRKNLVSLTTFDSAPKFKRLIRQRTLTKLGGKFVFYSYEHVDYITVGAFDNTGVKNAAIFTVNQRLLVSAFESSCDSCANYVPATTNHICVIHFVRTIS